MSDAFVLGWLIPGIFVVTGIVLFTASCSRLERTYELLRRSRETTGHVVRLEEGPRESGDEPGQRPVVEFTTEQGQRVEFRGQAFSNPPSFAPGAQVPVLYDPTRPFEARIRSFVELWGLATLLGVLGIVFAAVGAAVLLGLIPL